MSGVTNNYGLITVVEGESYDEEVFNTNNRTLDAALTAAALRGHGYKAYAEMAANSAPITATAVATFIPSFTFKAGRRYRVGASGGATMTDTASTFAVQISTCLTSDSSNDVTPAKLTQLKGRNVRTDAAGEGRELLLLAKENLIYGIDTTVQLKLLVGRLNGTGTMTLASDATNRVCLFIEDLGAQF